MCVCVCVCVCEGERESEREGGREGGRGVWVLVCLCGRESVCALKSEWQER